MRYLLIFPGIVITCIGFISGVGGGSLIKIMNKFESLIYEKYKNKVWSEDDI